MKHFQIVVKGIATNKISLIETTDYRIFKDTLKIYQEQENLNLIITTNIY